MVEGIEKVGITDDAAEDSLVVTKEHKGHLTRDGDGQPQLEAAAIPIELRRFEHVAILNSASRDAKRDLCW